MVMADLIYVVVHGRVFGSETPADSATLKAKKVG